MKFSDYADLAAINASALLQLRKSPKHYRHYLSHRSADTAATRLGRATHTAVLEPQQFLREYALWPSENGRRYGKKWDAFCEANAGKTILTESEYDQCQTLAGAVRQDPIAADYLTGPGKSELTIEWEVADRPAKCRIDWLGDYIVDLKTTRDAEPRAFGRASARLGYHIRAAFYTDAVYAATGDTKRFAMVCVEKDAPHDVVVYEVPTHVVSAGRDAYVELLATLRECEERDEWPGYGRGSALDLELPAWAMSDAEELIIDGERVAL